MCLEIYCKSRAEARHLKKHPLVAKEDIEVYKVFEKTGNQLVSPFKRFIYNRGYIYYQVGKQFEVSHNERERPKYLSISEGLHSYKSLDDARRAFIYVDDSSRIALKCIIPKDSLYYEDNTEIASNQLLIPHGAKPITLLKSSRSFYWSWS